MFHALLFSGVVSLLSVTGDSALTDGAFPAGQAVQDRADAAGQLLIRTASGRVLPAQLHADLLHTDDVAHKGQIGIGVGGERISVDKVAAILDGQVSRDVVMYNGSAYVVAVNSTAPVMGIVPEGDSTGRWALLAAKGEKGEPGEKGKEKRTVAVDISGFETEGKIVETYSDGTSVEYSFEFDSEGNPTKITDSDGNETVLTW